MVSGKSLKTLVQLFNVNYYLKLFPGFWNLNQNCIDLKYSGVGECLERYLRKVFICWKVGQFVNYLVPLIYAVSQISTFVYLVIFLIWFEYSTIELCMSAFLLVSYFLIISGQLSLLLHFEDFCYLFNAFFAEDLKLRKNFK